MITNPISPALELRDTLKLAEAIILSQVGNMSMGLSGHAGRGAHQHNSSRRTGIGCECLLDFHERLHRLPAGAETLFRAVRRRQR